MAWCECAPLRPPGARTARIGGHSGGSTTENRSTAAMRTAIS